MATLFVDNQAFEVEEGQNLLQACLGLGFDLPYFCWHPALGSVGACRQCAVKTFKDEQDEAGRIVMACMTPVADGARISIGDPEASEFRMAVIAWLMSNHPHDCPVCDEGGECHLQDMTVMTGHVCRQHRFDKRTFNNQDLGPFLHHEMNRCIQCYRCVRFYADFAGGRDLCAFASRNRTWFGRFRAGPLENPFSGNLVEVCPTGVFTDRTFKRHATRKWDLQTAPSVCVHCSLGCNTLVGERYGSVRRVLNRYHGELNGYFLCDRGRFGYEFMNSDRRVTQPMLRAPGGSVPMPAEPERVLSHASGLCADPERLVGVGSPRASLEANFLLRELVGPERFIAGVSAHEALLTAQAIGIQRDGPARTPSLQEVARSDAALVLGEDITHTAPLLALALRQAARQPGLRQAQAVGIPAWDDAAVRNFAPGTRAGAMAIATPAPCWLDDVAALSSRAAPDDLARLGFQVAHRLNPDAPAPVDPLPGMEQRADEIAAMLLDAERPVIVTGTGSGSQAMLQAAANVAWALSDQGKPAALAIAQPACNSAGLAQMTDAGIDAAAGLLGEGRADTLVILECDLARILDRETARRLLDAARHVIVLDHLMHFTAQHAEVVLPAATFAETTGTLVNYEGRAQRAFRVVPPLRDVRPSYRWLQDVLDASGRTVPDGTDAILAALEEEVPALAGVGQAAPGADFRLGGQKVPRQPHRYSGRTSLGAHLDVSEPKPPDDAGSPLAHSMEGHPGQPPAALTARYWSPGWNSVQALNRFQEEIAGPMRGGDAGTCLLQPARRGPGAYFADAPEAHVPRDEQLLMVPVHHVFGSEELSGAAPAVAARAPAPYVALHPDDHPARRGGDTDVVEVEIDGETRRVRGLKVPGMPRGVAGMPAGLPGFPPLERPVWIRIRRP